VVSNFWDSGLCSFVWVMNHNFDVISVEKTEIISSMYAYFCYMYFITSVLLTVNWKNDLFIFARSKKRVYECLQCAPPRLLYPCICFLFPEEYFFRPSLSFHYTHAQLLPLMSHHSFVLMTTNFFLISPIFPRMHHHLHSSFYISDKKQTKQKYMDKDHFFFLQKNDILSAKQRFQ
jgi:hypothetical protein